MVAINQIRANERTKWRLMLQSQIKSNQQNNNSNKETFFTSPKVKFLFVVALLLLPSRFFCDVACRVFTNECPIKRIKKYLLFNELRRKEKPLSPCACQEF
jgi:hypothetical protein